MRSENGTTFFSPSDLTAFLACPHLTTLELAVARGELERPFRRQPARRPDPAQGRRARGCATSLGSAPSVVRDRRSRGRSAGKRPPRATEQAMRDGAPSSTRPRFVDGDWRGLADFLERQPDGGYEVVDTKLARHAQAGARPPALLLHRAARADPGARAGGDARRQRARRARDLPARTTSSPTTGGSSGGSSTRSRAAATTYPYPVDHCGLCDFLALCEAAVGATTTTSSLVAGISRTAGRAAHRGRASRRSRRSATRRPRRGSRSIRAADLREAPPPGRAPAPPAPHRRAPRRPAPARAGARLRAAARAEPGRHLARLRGRPVVRAGARARVPVRLGRARRGRRAALRRASGRATATRRRRRSSG